MICAARSCGKPASGLRLRLLRRSGYRVGKDWFCGEACLGEGLVPVVEKKLSMTVLGRHGGGLRPTLGLILLEQGLFDRAVLEEALRRQKEGSNEKIGALLRRLGHVTERDITLALARQYGLPWVNFVNGHISRAAVRALPTVVARTYQAIPIDFRPGGRELLVAIVGPPDYAFFQGVGRMLDVEATPLVADESKIRELLDRFYPESKAVGRLRRLDDPDPERLAAAIARLAGRYRAEWVRVERLSRHLWARLEREGRTADFLFALPEAASAEAVTA